MRSHGERQGEEEAAKATEAQAVNKAEAATETEKATEAEKVTEAEAATETTAADVPDGKLEIRANLQTVFPPFPSPPPLPPFLAADKWNAQPVALFWRRTTTTTTQEQQLNFN